ncbi:substrate-binding domain-containing protein [Actinoplanes sp. GCM10030250]|uniref:substrate-binding domain-containing protein n=1 Tax=Actinoplanes sp. GCM10030250 TaxID=3273376 RepID=UPI0036140D24
MPDDVVLVTDPLEARLLAPAPGEAVRIGIVVPTSGPLGLLAPSAVNCAVLAAAELNAAGGILGRPVELTLVDGGRPPGAVAAEVAGLVRANALAAVVGTHASDVRVPLMRVLGGRVPYVFTPPYEGGDRTPGVFALGETPQRQLRPALDRLLAGHARRWLLLGNDYVWPRRVHEEARRYLTQAGADVVGERYVPLGGADAAALVDDVIAARVDAVLLTLVGSDLVTFNRMFAESAGAGRVARVCAALEENGLLGAGGDGSGELYAAMGYFAALSTDAALDFAQRYTARFGVDAPVLNGHGEGTYDGVRLLAALAARAGCLAAPALDAVAEGTRVTGGRGPFVLRDRHAVQPVYVARANGLDFEVLTTG